MKSVIVIEKLLYWHLVIPCTLSLELEEKYIRRWAVVDNLTEDQQGQLGDGTTIDREEPFIIRIKCDADGWILQVNQEPAYDTFLHRLPVPDILNVKMKGSAHISYVGFGTDGKLIPQQSILEGKLGVWIRGENWHIPLIYLI